MSEIIETWKKIEGYEYSVSDLGRIRNDKTDKILKQNPNSVGYYMINLRKNGIMKTFACHRLIAIAFIPNPDSKKYVDHINGDRLNNSLNNLRWATASENALNSKLRTGSKTGIKGVTICRRAKKIMYMSNIRIDGINICLGRFNTLEEAKEIRIKRANEAFGVFVNSCERLEI
jgi:hypothetical protein